MADRVELHNPAAESGVISVPESEVDRFIEAGWERVGGRGRRRATENTDTGSHDTSRPSRQSER